VTRILITGSRNWTDRDAILNALVQAVTEFGNARDLTLVHGACPTGADQIAHELWTGHLSRFNHVERHPADWQQFGRGAGPKRNQEMVDLGADICLAFMNPGSRGTADCVRRAEKAGIPVRVFRP
jgi:hypothetical protein